MTVQAMEGRLTVRAGDDEACRVQPCECGCEQLVDPRAGRRYVDDRHRQRAYRDRLRAELAAHGLPTSLSLRTAQTADPPRLRHGDAPRGQGRGQRRRQTPGQVRYGYPKLLARLEDDYAALGVADPATRARELLWSLSTDRQREAIRG